MKGTSQIVTKESQINEYEKYMKLWFGSREAYYSFDIFCERSPLTNVDVDKRLGIAMIAIHKNSVLDDELNDINKRYQILQEKYPDIIGALLDILFPKFFRDAIREEYRKNVTNSSNLLTR